MTMRMSSNNDFQRMILLMAFWGATKLFVPCSSCGWYVTPTTTLDVYESKYNNYLAKPFLRGKVSFNETLLVKKLWSFQCGIFRTPDGLVNASVTPAPAPPKTFQWTVALNTKSLKMCSGALISDRWVLTTAECATPKIDELYLGVNNASGSKVEVDKTIIHNDYNNATKKNNIALLRLKTRVFLTENIRPVCIPTQEMDLVSTSCYISGFENISATFEMSTLKYVSANIMPLEICYFAYWLKNMSVDVREVCADVWGRKGCYYNLGSPLTCAIEDRHYLAGVFSFTLGKCATFAEPLVFTRLEAYSQWIYRIVDFY